VVLIGVGVGDRFVRGDALVVAIEVAFEGGAWKV